MPCQYNNAGHSCFSEFNRCAFCPNHGKEQRERESQRQSDSLADQRRQEQVAREERAANNEAKAKNKKRRQQEKNARKKVPKKKAAKANTGNKTTSQRSSSSKSGGTAFWPIFGAVVVIGAIGNLFSDNDDDTQRNSNPEAPSRIITAPDNRDNNSLLLVYKEVTYSNGDTYHGPTTRWSDGGRQTDLRLLHKPVIEGDRRWGTYTWSSGAKHIGGWHLGYPQGNGKRTFGQTEITGLWHHFNDVTDPTCIDSSLNMTYTFTGKINLENASPNATFRNSTTGRTERLGFCRSLYEYYR